MNMLLGGGYAIIAAILWAVFSSMLETIARSIPPKELNIFKGAMACVLMVATSLLLRENFHDLPWSDVWILFLSGIVGIGLGDTAYYAGLSYIGSRRSLLLFALAPPMAALIAWIFLGESLNLLAWAGILITISGVAWVISERTPQDTIHHDPKLMRKGIILGVLASLGQATGLVLSRAGMSDGMVTSLQGAALRLIAGILFTLIWLLVSRQPMGKWQHTTDSKRIWITLVITAIGTYISLWLQQLAIQGAPAGITQTLLSTSPIFILPVAAIRGEKVTIRAVLGAFVTIFGVMMVFGLIG